MKCLLIVSFLLLSACGKPIGKTDPRSVVGVRSEFIPYVNIYIQNKGSGLSYDVPMGFADLSGNIAGICTRWSNGYRQIQIDEQYWNYATENQRISLIAHELGHCDLNRDHSPDWRSIMYEYNLGSFNFFELFNPNNYTYKVTTVDHGCVHDIEVE